MIKWLDHKDIKRQIQRAILATYFLCGKKVRRVVK